MATRKQILLVSTYATIIILAGVVLILTTLATTESIVPPLPPPPLPPSNLATSGTINPVIVVFVFLAIIATIILIAKGGMPKKAGVVGGWFANLFTSASGNKMLIVVIGGYILILVGIAQLLPSFWNWLGGQGWFFLCWLLVGLPMVIAIINAKLKFSLGLGLVWLAITLFASDWKPVDDWIEAKKLASSLKMGASKEPAAGRSATSSRVQTTITLQPGELPKKIWFPPNQRGWWETNGCVEITDGLGRHYDYCPGQKLDLGDNASPLEATLTFQLPARSNSNVEVMYGWEPR